MHASLTRTEIAAVLLTSLAMGNVLTTVAAIASAPRRYEARVELLVGDRTFVRDPQYRDPRIAAGMAEAYARIATSQPVVAEAITRLDLDLQVEELAPRVRTETVIGSSLFVVKVLDPDPNSAASIANEIAAILLTDSAGSQLGQQRLRIVERALPPAGSSEVYRLLAAALSGAIAVAIGLAIAFLPRDRNGQRRLAA